MKLQHPTSNFPPRTTVGPQSRLTRPSDVRRLEQVPLSGPGWNSSGEKYAKNRQKSRSKKTGYSYLFYTSSRFIENPQCINTAQSRRSMSYVKNLWLTTYMCVWT